MLLMAISEVLTPRKQGQIVRNAIESQSITTDAELATSVLRNSRYPDADFTNDDWEQYFTEEARSRVYVLRKLVDWLYKGDKPRSIVEICSAGTTHVAMALPNTSIYSVDFDNDHFLSHSNNTLPGKFFESMGKTKELEWWRRGNHEVQKSKLGEVMESLPNFHPVVADGTSLPFITESADIALILGQPNPMPFMDEMTRVISPGGFILVSTEDKFRPPSTSSAYVTNRFGSEYRNTSMVNEKSIVRLGLERLIIPATLRRYEDIATYQTPGENTFSTGFVFQVFRKEV